jgi:hypothetical protein
VRIFWKKLYNHHAEVILTGNTHRYERFARITPSGARSSARGIRQFIVGTGALRAALKRARTNLACRPRRSTPLVC